MVRDGCSDLNRSVIRVFVLGGVSIAFKAFKNASVEFGKGGIYRSWMFRLLRGVRSEDAQRRFLVFKRAPCPEACFLTELKFKRFALVSSVRSFAAVARGAALSHPFSWLSQWTPAF